jgi:uncharacterized protein (DUF2141 family)
MKMKAKFLAVVLVLISVQATMLAQYSVTIEITDLKNSKGQVLLMLLDENKKEIKGVSGAIKNNKCIIVLENLKPARYAFQYFHDENNSNSLNKNFVGIPKEGIGFSNNAKGSFGPPPFEKWLFNLSGNVRMSCKINYL